MASADTAAWPTPVFEGSEKRLEVDFAISDHQGLRTLDRGQLDQLMTSAGCCIVSDRHNDQFDAYVLSESSLFVFPHKLVLKTCGTTKILHAIPLLLELAASTGCTLKRCKYSRASFLYPQLQPEVYQNFDHEVSFLKQHFGHLGHGGDAHILGDSSTGLQWHVYVAGAEATVHQPAAAVYSLEVCMTELCQEKAVQFFRSNHFISAQHTSTSSGIQALLPNASIDDYVFEPCGYSMNGMEGAGFSTIHITPEDGFSYASFEVSNYPTQDLDINQLVTALVQIFNPGKLTVALTVDTNLPCCIWGESVQTPEKYSCHASCKQSFTCGGRTSFYSMAKQTKAPLSGMVPEPVSPMTIIERPPSAMSMSCHSDFDRFSNMDAAEDIRCKDSTAAVSSPPDPTFGNRMSVMSVLQCYNATMLDVGNDATYDAFINKVDNGTGDQPHACAAHVQIDHTHPKGTYQWK